ncbi:MAG: TetR/AcrR family transcriptional regulator [Desulfuromonadales bacterium]|nr:MAG: TetR/AcrR family transcriptional regulator [Desulfuromonadales bacterium]
MSTLDPRSHLITAATPLFAAKGLSGVNVREIARAAGVNPALISYHFGGKEGLYAAVIRDQFAGLGRIAAIADSHIAVDKKFASYLFECGICFHRGSAEQFLPATASANPDAPECPQCLNNDVESFAGVAEEAEKAA